MAKKKETTVEVPSQEVTLKLKVVRIPIRSCAPLIVNRFDDKTKREIAESAPGKLKQGKGKKAVETPEEQYENSIYYLSDGSRTGFPAVGFKDAMVRVGKELFGMPMVSLRGYFHVLPDDPGTGLVEIHGEHRMREDMVRVGGINKVASPRYRACYNDWSAVVTIRYIADVISETQLFGLLNAAGFSCGIGEWRPEKSNSGSFGLFEVASN